MLLNRSTLKLASLTSKEASRYTLQGIYIEDKQATVTDGHILVTVTHSNTAHTEDHFPATDGLEHAKVTGDAAVLVHRDAALAALKLLPKRSSIPVLQHAAMSTDGKLFVNTLDSVQSFKHELIGQFPNYRAVLPKDEPIAEVCFNAKLLKQLVDYFVSVDDERAVAVRLTVYGKEKPMRIDGRTTDEQDVIAFAMPIKADSSKYVERPDQVRAREAVEAAERAEKSAAELAKLDA